MSLKPFIGAVGLVLVLSAPGCYSSADPPAASEGEAYTPLYYEGHIVYYDDTGVPFINLDHKVQYVLRDYPQYDVLVANYRGHEAAYRAWFRAHSDDESDTTNDNFREHHQKH